MSAAGFYALVALITLSAFRILRVRRGPALTAWGFLVLLSLILIVRFYLPDLARLHSFLFYLFSMAALMSAFFVVTSGNPVHSACWLLVSLLNVAFLFVLLEAEFVAAVQILIYAGAIVVMYLFMVTMIDFHRTMDLTLTRLSVPMVVILALSLYAEVCYLLHRGKEAFVAKADLQASGIGNVEAVGGAMFTGYALPFEVVSVALLIALVGAVVIGKRRYGE